MPVNKKGGIVTTVIFGVGALIIAVIVILMITQTLTNANLISDDSTTTVSVLNESVTFPYTIPVVQTLSSASILYATCNAPTIYTNGTATGALLSAGNFTVVGCTITNATDLNHTGWGGNGTVYVSYTYTKTERYSKNALGNMTTNFTDGIDNISEKIPTILLIVAVVILFGALVLLVRNTQLMGVFGGSREGSL